MKKQNKKSATLDPSAEHLHHEQVIVVSKYASYLEQSAKYGQLLVTNLMVINAGALLIFPVLIDKLKNNPADINDASLSALLFVLGILFAAISAYSAYINFACLAQDAVMEQNLKDFKSRCTQEMLILPANAKVIAEMVRSISKNAGVIWWSVVFGNCSGILSMISFCAGCYFVRAAVI